MEALAVFIGKVGPVSREEMPTGCFQQEDETEVTSSVDFLLC